ncbi:MAG: hypothetical protein KA715_10315 [Xanthomonadaceae bacterium]|nr:hypothetical protein [Xanthomonadaceae bacterium]
MMRNKLIQTALILSGLWFFVFLGFGVYSLFESYSLPTVIFCLILLFTPAVFFLLIKGFSKSNLKKARIISIVFLSLLAISITLIIGSFFTDSPNNDKPLSLLVSQGVYFLDSVIALLTAIIFGFLYLVEREDKRSP